MAAALVLLLVLALILGVGINVYLRSWVQAESRTEAHLRDPRTHTLAYAVPNGVDPALIRAELSRAGFQTGIGRVGDNQCLLVECERQQRDRVRRVINDVHMSAYDGSALKLRDVVFEDER